MAVEKGQTMRDRGREVERRESATETETKRHRDTERNSEGDRE